MLTAVDINQQLDQLSTAEVMNVGWVDGRKEFVFEFTPAVNSGTGFRSGTFVYHGPSTAVKLSVKVRFNNVVGSFTRLTEGDDNDGNVTQEFNTNYSFCIGEAKEWIPTLFREDHAEVVDNEVNDSINSFLYDLSPEEMSECWVQGRQNFDFEIATDCGVRRNQTFTEGARNGARLILTVEGNSVSGRFTAVNRRQDREDAEDNMLEFGENYFDCISEANEWINGLYRVVHNIITTEWREE